MNPPFKDNLWVLDLSLSAEELLFSPFDRDDDAFVFGASIVYLGVVSATKRFWNELGCS
jgi:hypothetical protein